MITLDYTYEIRKISSKHQFMVVVYRSPDREDVTQTFNPTDFSQAAITAMIVDRVPATLWEYQDTSVDVDPTIVVGDEVSEVYVSPPSPEPEPELTPEQVLAVRIGEIGIERRIYESMGVTWVDAVGDTFWFDSSSESQNRLDAAISAINRGVRTGSPVWKCAAINEAGEMSAVYRPLSNTEITEVGNMVYAHIQKCFDAEKNTVDKAIAGVVSDIATEYNAL